MRRMRKTMGHCKKRIRRGLAGLLAAALTVGITGGCSLQELGSDDWDKTYDSFITITVFDTLANYEGIQSGWFAEIVKEKFNMELNIIAPNVSSDGDALYLERFASGNIGDLIICGNSGGQLQELVNAGLVVDMRSYLTDKDVMQKYSLAIQNLADSIQTSDSSAVYAIPTSISTAGAMVPSEADTPNYGCYLRYDLYEELGCPEIETLEDLLPILKQMQELCPVSDSGEPVYAFSFFGDWDGNMTTYAKQPACFYGYDEQGFVLLNAEGTDYQDILDEDGLYYRSLKFFNEAYRMGLVDPDSATNSYADVFAKTQDGQVLFAAWPWLGQSAYNTAAHLSEGKAMMFIPIEDESIYCPGSSETGSSEVVVCVGSQAKDVERIVDFIDWLYSSEGISIACAQRNQATAGPEGLTWEMTEEGPVLTDFGLTAFYENGDIEMPAEWGSGTWADGVCQLNFTPVAETEKDENGYPFYYEQWDSVKKKDRSEIELSWMDRYQATTVMGYIEENEQIAIAPATSIVRSSETTELATIRDQCGKIIVSYSWKLLMAEDEDEFEALFAEMKGRAYASGYQSIYEFDLEYALKLGKERQNVAASSMSYSTGVK